MVKIKPHWVLGLAVIGIAAQAQTLYRYQAPDGSVVFTDEPVSGAKPVEVVEPMTMPAVTVPGRSGAADSGEEVFWPEPGATARPRVEPTAKARAVTSSSTSWNSDTQGISAAEVTPAQPAPADDSAYDSLRPAPETTERLTMSEKMEPRRRSRPDGSMYESVRVVSPSAGSARWVGGELSVFLATKPALSRDHVISIQLDGREVARGPQLVTSIPNVARGTHALEAVILDARSGERIDGSDQVIFQIHRPSALRSSRMMHPSVNRGN